MSDFVAIKGILTIVIHVIHVALLQHVCIVV